MALIKLNTRSIPDNAVTPAKVSQNLGRRNMIINGAMQVSQYGTSATGITSGSNLTADRFSFSTGTNGGTYTLSTTTTVPSGEGFEKSLKIDCTTAGNYSTAGTATMLRCSPFEIQDCARLAYGTSSAKKLTVSFWTRASYTGTFTALLVTHDSAQRNIIKTFTISSANTWQKVVLTYDGDTGSTFTGADINLGLSLDIWFGGGTDYTGGSQTDGVWRARSTHNTSVLQGNGTLFGTSTSHDFYITGVQVEIGDAATDFEHRSYGEELDLCERYFQTYSNRNWQGTNEHAVNYSLYLDGVFTKKMRAAPAASIVGLVTIGRPQVSVSQRPNVIDGISNTGFRVCRWPSSGTYGGSLGSHGDAYYRMSVGTGPTNRIDFSAEL